MAVAITCPKCRATLKANKLPAAEKKLRCLKCGHPFAFGETASPKSTVPSTSLAERALRQPLLLGSLTVAVVVGLAMVGAFALNRPAAPPTVAKSPEPAVPPTPPPKVEAKVEPMVQAKVETKVDADLDRRRERFTQLMIDGGIAAQLKKFDNAAAAYAEAAKLFPDRADVRAKFDEAMAAADAADKLRRDAEKIEIETAALLKRGQAALDDNQFAAAVEFYKLALAKMPTNAEAAEKLLLAQDRQQKAEQDQKAVERFDQHIRAGKLALAANRPADAIREFVAAGKAVPADPLPGELIKQAEKQFAQVKNEDERKKQFQSLIDQGAALLRVNNNEAAEDAFRQAMRIYPNDPAALRGLESAQMATKRARADVANLLAQAQNAIAAGQLPTAMIYLRDAEKIMPNNPDVQRAVRAAQLIQANQAVYFQAINRATSAMTLRRYGDAVLAYSEALRVAPNDPQATTGLLEAQRGLEAVERKRREVDALINQALAALKIGRYGEASRNLDAAVKLTQKPPLLPDQQVQSLARYAEAMHQAGVALNASQFLRAAQYYQLALVEIPNDLAAQGGLQKARLGVKK